MSLIKPKLKVKKVKIRINIDESILEKIRAYAAWAGFEKIDDAIEEAVQFLFQQDKEWRTQNKQ